MKGFIGNRRTINFMAKDIFLTSEKAKALTPEQQLRSLLLSSPTVRSADEEDVSAVDALLEKYLAYRELVLSANQEINMTAITDPDEFLEKHFLDSLAIISLPEFTAATRCIDVGTGAGFPGAPLALFDDSKEWVLLDSLQKRMAFVQGWLEELSICNAETMAGRAEDLAKDPAHRERYDLCVSRAVADLPILLEYCLPFVSVGGSFVAYKGATTEDEVERSAAALEKLGGTVDRVIKKAIPMSADAEEHTLVVVKKQEPTPAQYPRNAGIPKKRPL